MVIQKQIQFNVGILRILKKKKNGSLEYIPGEYKLFDELIVNSLDQYIRLLEFNDSNLIPVKNIKVTADTETGEISVYNDGEGIRIEKHPKKINIYLSLYLVNFSLLQITIWMN